MKCVEVLSCAWLVVVVACCGGAEPLVDTLLPRPKQLERIDSEVRLFDNGEARSGIVTAGDAAAIRLAARELNDAIEQMGEQKLRVGPAGELADAQCLIWLGTRDDADGPETVLAGQETPFPEEAAVRDGYIIDCRRRGGQDIIACIGYDARGCYYAVQTLKQLLRAEADGIRLPRVRIVDWPTFKIRLVKVSATRPDPDVAAHYAEVLPRYKINVYALQYHREGNGTWRDPSGKYKGLMERVGAIARERQVIEPGIYVCPYFPPRLDATKPEDMEEYLDRLRWALDMGFKWVEVDFNDWAKWDLLSEAEQEEFEGAGAYMAHVVNEVYDELRAEYPEVGVIVCPMIGHYHGRASKALIELCRGIRDDVLVYWTGPVVRSRHISREQITAWTKETGRKPFLWDNTIYAHFQPYWVGYAFNPYQNALPEDLAELLAGPGIHLNANAAPHYGPGMMTFADFLWNPEDYDPERSVRNALRLYWGEEAPDQALEVQRRLTAIHKLLYEAERGWREFEREKATAMVDELEEAVAELSGIAGSEKLGAHLERAFVADARKAVEDLEPPEKLAARPPVTARPLAEGVVNPSAEEIEDGAPIGWSLYTGAGEAKLIVSEQAYSGEHSACVEAVKWYHNPEHYRHGDRRWLNVALIHGSEQGGFEGCDAYDVEPDTTYRCSFYLKGDVPEAFVEFQGWGVGCGAGHRHLLKSELQTIEPTPDWQQYEATFRTWFDTEKFALKIGMQGYEDEGMELGRIWVDDVSIEEVE